MPRQEHHERAADLSWTDDVDRLFVAHAVDPTVLADRGAGPWRRRIRWLTVAEAVRDLLGWYRAHRRVRMW